MTGLLLIVVAVEQPTERAEHRAFADLSPAGIRGRRDDPVRQTRQRQRLQPDSPRTGERREEQACADKQRALPLADILNIEVDTRLERDDAARIDAHLLARLQI